MQAKNQYEEWVLSRNSKELAEVSLIKLHIHAMYIMDYVWYAYTYIHVYLNFYVLRHNILPEEMHVHECYITMYMYACMPCLL